MHQKYPILPCPGLYSLKLLDGGGYDRMRKLYPTRAVLQLPLHVHWQNAKVH